MEIGADDGKRALSCAAMRLRGRKSIPSVQRFRSFISVVHSQQDVFDWIVCPCMGHEVAV